MLKKSIAILEICLFSSMFFSCGPDEPDPIEEEATEATDNSESGYVIKSDFRLLIKDSGQHSLDLYVPDEESKFYISVLMDGNAPIQPVKSTLKILNDEEFRAYKEHKYGNSESEELHRLKSRFYHLNSCYYTTTGVDTLNHTFKIGEESYFAGVVTFNTLAIAEWISDLEKRARPNNKTKNPEEWQLANDSLNNMEFVVPIGLFSENFNDSIDNEKRYVIIRPRIQKAMISVSIGNDEAVIIEQNRSLLMDDKSDYRNGSFGQNLIKFLLPCANPYGFQIKFNNNPDTDIARFNSHHTDMMLTRLPRRDENNNLNFFLGLNNRLVDYIDFPAGNTEVWLPVEFFRNQIDYNDTEHIFATSVQLAGFNWKSSDAPRVFYDYILLPESDKTWEPTGGYDDGRYNGYTFFIGYKVTF